MIPCYNKEEDVGPMAETLMGLFRHELAVCDYKLIFTDNDSQDRVKKYFRTLCAENHKIKAIFNAKNFGQLSSPYYETLQSAGGAAVLMAIDFQNPSKMIAEYVATREEGYKIVIDIKIHSMEDPFIYYLRSLYYKWIRKLSEMGQIEHFTGFGLYDKGFVQALRGLDDPTPFPYSIATELGYRRRGAPYDQPKHYVGKTSNNLYKLYDVVIFSMISHTKFDLRLATFFGGIILVMSIVITSIYLMIKLPCWDCFQAGLVPLLIDMLFPGAVQIFFTGMVDEYVLMINQYVMEHPLAVEAKRLNFENEDVEETR